MNFINKYPNGKAASVYQYAEEFMEYDPNVESTVSAIYAVGTVGGVPSVTKTDSDGNLLWEKNYTPGEFGIDITFHKIIQVNGEQTNDHGDGGIGGHIGPIGEVGETGYVVYGSAGTTHYLMCINVDGTVRWCKQLYWADSDINFFLEPSLTHLGFFISISGRDPVSGSPYPFVWALSANGDVTVSRIIYFRSGFQVNGIKAHSGGIALAGYFVENGSPFGALTDLDSGLNINFSTFIEDPSVIYHDVEVIGNTFLLSGYSGNYGSLFVTAYIPNVIQYPLYIFPYSEEYASKLCAGVEKNTFYFLQYNGQQGIIHFLTTDFLQLWTKTLNLDPYPNQVTFLNDLKNTRSLTFIAGDENITQLLVHTNSDLDSCKTTELNWPELPQFECSILSETPAVKEADLELAEITMLSTVNEPYKLECCPGGGGGDVPVDENTVIQSPDFYLQAAGSTGADGSAIGIHLRWIFAGALGQKHLPKGDYAGSSYNFNKADDYVSVYRTPYVKAQTILDLSATPYLVDHSNKVWLYRVGTKVFYVYFRNPAKYEQAKALYNPLHNPQNFINAYGNELIEIENKKELFFAAGLELNISGFSDSIRTETLSVAENALAVSRTLSSRQIYSGFDLNNIRIVCENGRSLRLKPSGCTVLKIYFELYSEFISSANSRQAWQLMDKYALTLDDGTALTRLEPSPGLIDGKWQRYNDNAFVNISNYQHKWNGPRESWDRNIKGVVEKYIALSNALANPRALENVPLQSGAPPGDDMLEVSNLDLLNMAAYDYHIARMLGLGTLDVSVSGDNQFVYIGRYTTAGDLEDGDGARTVHHLAMSIPVSTYDQRLPLAIKLKEIIPGAFWGNESPEPVTLTDANGYTQDGRSRYVTLYADQLPEDEMNKPFWFSDREFNTVTFTYPVYAGLEYKKNAETQWVKPELPNDPKYQNKVPVGQSPHNETIPLVLPEPQRSLFVHRQRVTGTHYYSSYGINWFSRAASSATVRSIVTNIQPINPLRPPSNINALLIRQESPLILTSPKEQDRYEAITTQDHTLIRLAFDYHSFQELIDYKIPLGANINDPNIIPADNTEIFADKVEIFFRNQVPGNVSGKALSITDHPVISILSVIQTGDYTMTSTGQILQPVIPMSVVANYTGGLFIMGDQQFIIHQVVLPGSPTQGPKFIVYKKEISNGIVTNEIPAAGTQNLEAPEIVPDGLFMAVENMQNAASWGTPNPLPLQVNIGTGWTVNREVITITNDDGSTEQYLEKTRGLWDNADIQPILEPVTGGTAHRGLYKITFQNIALPHHAQFNGSGVSVEWYGGIIRIHTQAHPIARRKTLKVLRLENVGSSTTLVVYANDASFVDEPSYEKVITGIASVNYYPGYKTYLYTDAAYGLTEANILPQGDEDVHYSIFGLRSHDLNDNCYSRISIPQLMFAQQQAEPEIPEMPVGSLYATRPDFFGRATYTFTTKYQHRPNGMLTCRADDEILLNTLYAPETVIDIRQHLEAMGGNDEPFFTNRWRNFLNFTELETDGDYKAFPPNAPDAYKLPYPDNEAFYGWMTALQAENNEPVAQPGDQPAGAIIKYVRRAIAEVFVPLTEVPVLHQHIKGGSYKPLPKNQVIRDRNGNVLNPADPAFDMAPMMRVTGGTNDETSFTDFNLDGTSKNFYFYGVREMNAQMKMGDFSPFLGPVKLVNTNPPSAPEVKRIMPVLENATFGVGAGIQLEVNAYDEVHRVKKLNIYRAFNQLDAQSVRSMTLVKTIDLDATGILTDNIWQVKDSFEDLTEIPYNDGLFYKITALRKIEYADMDGNIITEYAPSQPSKLTATMIVENYNPLSPVISFTSDAITPQGELNNVKLKWDKTAYKAKYHVYKMNASGNWTKIHELTTNDAHIELLLADTDLQSGVIQTKDADGNNLYSHFKVVAENTSGMLSLEENILTIPQG